MSLVNIKNCEIIGEGTRRICYAYPDNPSRCIKIPKPDRSGIKQQLREVRFYEQLARRGVQTDCIAVYYGTVDTDQGPGYVYEAIRDADGSISSLYIDVIGQKAQESPEELRGVLTELERYFFENLIVFYDINPWNIVCQRTSSGKLRPYVIDGIGDVVAIPILNWSKVLLRKKIKRRWIRLLNNMRRNHAWMADYQFTH